MASLGQAADGLNRQFIALGAVRAARPARARSTSATPPSNHRGRWSRPSRWPSAERARRRRRAVLGALAKLTASLDNTGAIEQLMGVLFNGAGATNAFDSAGHYVRDAAIIGSCTAYATNPVPDLLRELPQERRSSPATRPRPRTPRRARSDRSRRDRGRCDAQRCRDSPVRDRWRRQQRCGCRGGRPSGPAGRRSGAVIDARRACSTT